MAQTSSFVLALEAAKPYGVDPKALFSYLDLKESLGLAPISRLNVGAVGIASSGIGYFGISVELPGLPLHHSIHAVQFLVANLALHSESHLTHLAVSLNNFLFDAPCGHCRQFVQEIMEASNIEILINNPATNIKEYVTLDKLLPNPEACGPHYIKSPL